MKKLVLILSILAVATFAQAQVNTDFTKVFPASMGAVTFNHATHSSGDISCLTCHHTSDNITYVACTSCHGAKPEAPKSKKAFHKLCRDCHKEHKPVAPTKCKGCHVK